MRVLHLLINAHIVDLKALRPRLRVPRRVELAKLSRVEKAPANGEIDEQVEALIERLPSKKSIENCLKKHR